MVYKDRDSLDARLQLLEQSLAKATTTAERNRWEKDIAILKAGAKGEDEAAYHIDFHLKSSPNWAVIHDLRLEWRGRVAQIDHLLIDRFLQINVVESKSFRTKVRYANGGWERINFNHWEGISSPVDQDDQHKPFLPVTDTGHLFQHANPRGKLGLKRGLLYKISCRFARIVSLIASIGKSLASVPKGSSISSAMTSMAAKA